MAISAANRTRYQAMAQSLLPEEEVRGLVLGRAGVEPLTIGVVLVVAFAIGAFAFYQLTGGYFYVGFFAVYTALFFASPPRCLVICDDEVVVIERSFFRSRPSSATGSRARFDELTPTRTSVVAAQVPVGLARIWLSKGEDALLRRAMTSTRSPFDRLSAATTVAPPEPEPAPGPAAHAPLDPAPAAAPTLPAAATEASDPAARAAEAAARATAAAAEAAAAVARAEQAAAEAAAWSRQVDGVAAAPLPSAPVAAVAPAEPLQSSSVPLVPAALRAEPALADLPPDVEIEPAVLRAAQSEGRAVPSPAAPDVVDESKLEPAVRRALEEARLAGELP